VRPRVYKEVTLKYTVKLLVWVMPSSLEKGHRRKVEKTFKMEMEHISTILHGF